MRSYIIKVDRISIRCSANDVNTKCFFINGLLSMSATEAVTFRFEQGILRQLRLEAQYKQINTNTLLNQIVTSHLEWHANATKAGFIPVRKTLLKELFDSITKDDVDRIAVRIAQHVNDETMLITSRNVSVQSILEVIERWIRMCGFNYHHKVDEDKNGGYRHTYVIQHDIGMNWSRYLAGLFEESVSEFMTCKPETTITENTLFIAISLK
jgi:hypothetical protein